MTTKLALAMLLATISVAEANRPIPNDRYLAELQSHELAGYYADPKYPDLKTLTPRGDCSIFSEKHTFDVPIVSDEVLYVPWTFGIGASIGIHGTNSSMGAEASIGPTLSFLGRSTMPIDVTFTAAATNSGSSLDVSINSFGYTLVSYNVASSPTPIAYDASFGYSIPDGDLDVSMGDTYDCPLIDDCSFTWQFDAEAVANAGAILKFKVAPSGVEARALASVHLHAGLAGRASVDVSGATVQGSVDGSLDLVRLVFGGRALLVPNPYTGQWVVDAAADLMISDTMGAYGAVSASLPIIGPETFVLFDVDALTWNGGWEYSCVYEPQVKFIE